METRLVTNNPIENTKVGYELNSLLKKCNDFCISVAFINKSGLAVLKQALLDLEAKNIHGKIITSTYLGFNEPQTFKELLTFKNIDVRIYEGDGFHPKGYIFNLDDATKIIVGSSNITQSALLSNQEWNVLLSSKQNEAIALQITNEFAQQWNASTPLTYAWIDEYSKNYQPIPRRQVVKKQKKELVPNQMQKQALASLKALRIDGKNKALIISATGTGKTYLSAFDVREFKPNKMLFIVHRENIARAAMRSFQNVLGDINCGLFTGNQREAHADYLFATIQTIHKKEYREMFEKDEFDYIIIDEVHRAGANTYQDIFEYFEPKFLLGMSATPERTDSFDIFKLFDYNIAYEIRLQEAMKHDLLCPFHYYGISDFEINGETIDDKTEFNRLVSSQRVDYIIDRISRYGYSGDRARGLVFCSRKDEARELSKLFNERGYRTVALTGENSESSRQEAIDLLETDDKENYLDYIFTVDIFNEGIDIPRVNQVVMLRPTESHIVFVQQLGRGLRKNNTKDYVVVIDFIGNYDKNFQIPIALSGNLSYNKDALRRFVLEGDLAISGDSTIDFDEISAKRIFETIDKANFSEVKLIKESYKQLKNKLGRIPKLKDFDTYSAIDPVKIFQNKSLGSYHKFLKKYEPDYETELSKLKEQYLEFISLKYGQGKRIQELESIKHCVENPNELIKRLNQTLKKKYQIELNPLSKETILNQLTQNYATGSAKASYKDVVFIEKKDVLKVSSKFKELLKDEKFKKQVLEILNFGISRYQTYYQDRYKDTDFCLYQKYTYEDVCRLLNWDKNIVALNIGGYKYDERTNTFPVFINYDKQEDISDSTKYEDHFVDRKTIIAYSKSKRTLESSEVVRVYNEKETKVKVHLFVRKNKNDAESKEFYYLGFMHAINQPIQSTMPITNESVVQITYKLENEVRQDIYDYITK